MSPASEALGCTGVWKRFGDLVANRDVSLSVARGTIHAVIGENGAGKSTLMRALYGLAPPDAGEVRIFGERIARPSVEASIARKVGMVHQHFMLVPTLTVAENVVLGREPRRGPLLDAARAAAEVAALSRDHGLAVEPRRLVGELSVGEAQRVELLKILWRGAEVLILDEPTAVLTPAEVKALFAVLRALAAAGRTVVVVTHKLDEVLALASRVTVLRRGEVVAERDTAGATAAELAHAMIGRPVALDARRPARPRPTGQVRLAVEGLAAGRLDGVSLTVRGGEILGVGGVEGNGQTELGLAVAGVLPARAGRVLIDGADLTAEGVAARRRRGLAHVPEDRQGRGLVLDFSVEENLLLGDDRADGGWLGLDRRRLRARALLERLDVRPPDPSAPARALSGGNQQKLVVGRELGFAPGVLVCAQPTRGVDVGAIEAIHAELEAARARGCAILLLSAELDELLALADRIVVLYRGRIAGERDNTGERGALRDALGALMLGAQP